MVERAEAPGIDTVFFTEHFLEDGYLPQPLVYAAAAAAARKRGCTSITLAPLRRASITPNGRVSST